MTADAFETFLDNNFLIISVYSIIGLGPIERDARLNACLICW